MDQALGLIETKGLIGAIEAADAMTKAASVKLISKEYVTGALVVIKVIGETAAVKASVDAGSAAAQRIGELVSAHVIPRPDDQIDLLLFDNNISEPEESKTDKSTVKAKSSISELKDEIKPEVVKKNEDIKNNAPKDDSSETPGKKATEKNKPELEFSESKIPSMEQLVVLNVHSLRRIARGIGDFPIKGREISKANRAKLLDYFKELQ